MMFRLKALMFRLVGCILLATLFCSSGKKNEYGDADTNQKTTRIPSYVTPIIDHWMRDTYIMNGGDGYYYMTGTTATPDRVFPGQVHCWDWNDGIYLFRSKDLQEWEPMGMVWSLDKDATWQKEFHVFKEGEKRQVKSVNGDPLENKYRAVWAPELHYIKSQKNWFMVACMSDASNYKGSFILRSTTGRPEGPYVNIKDNEEKPLFDNIDGSLFEDEDGTVYFVGHNHYIARMKKDMSGLDEPIRKLDEQTYSPEPYIEGAYIFRHKGKYHLVQAIWSYRLPSGKETYCPEMFVNDQKYSYDCVIASADNIYGPYSPRYNSITGGGHNNLFCDNNGHWWATIFFNPRGAQAKEYPQTCRPGIVPMKYKKGKFVIDNKRRF